MNAVRMDGSALRDHIIEALHRRTGAPGAPTVGLATLVVGDDPASLRYVELKHRAAARAGIATRAILVQLPLPPALDDDTLADVIDPAKDVDGLTAANLGRLLRGAPALVPPTAAGILRLLDTYGVTLAGRRVVIIGRSPLVGLPLALLVGRRGASVTVTEADDPGLAEACRAADVLVSDASRPHLIGAGMVKPGAAVVDVGVSRPEGKLVGDVDTDAVGAVAGALAPNPGGAGPMTVACLLENTLLAAQSAGAFPR
jgi:methylenetetrahydrofolate dehydrogenase (NADP+)/methenyltetrahydrofolate cyclohydrolase